MFQNKKKQLLALFFFTAISIAKSDNSSDTTQHQKFNLHFQQTVITQFKPAFVVKYTGFNSLSPNHEIQTSLTSTLFMGARLWKGAEMYVNPEIAGGSGLSQARGIAGFSNGETFRIGSSEPKVYIARAYLTQIFKLKGEDEKINDDANQLSGKHPKHNISITAGKFSVADFFDNNTYSHDPRSTFFNWSLMSNGAWDYPANTRGYTWGGVAAYNTPSWTLRYALTMVPEYANGPYMDLKFGKANASTLEFEKQYNIKSKEGTLRVLTFYNQSKMGNYKESIALSPVNPTILATRKYSRNKYGIGINAEQKLTATMGGFARASWNDGKNETWAFTEIDESASIGVIVNGDKWKRKDDQIGLAFVTNGISKDHREYLKAGGYGFIIGDGKLNYANEMIGEIFYKLFLDEKYFWVTPDYQFILNPAYNKDRGYVNVFSLRAHAEF